MAERSYMDVLVRVPARGNHGRGPDKFTAKSETPLKPDTPAPIKPTTGESH
jgi:hypothetical protein